MKVPPPALFRSATALEGRPPAIPALPPAPRGGPPRAAIRRLLVPVLALTLIAFAMRVHQLGLDSFWLDEADALRLASADPHTLVGRLTAAGENGPLYYLLLRGWLGLAGTSEFGLRYLSLLAGVAIVPLLFVSGRRLINGRAGLVAAFLGTLSSFLVGFARENKMYAWVAFFALLSLYGFARALDSGRPRWWVAHGLATTVAIYLHVFCAFLLPAELLYFALGGRGVWRAWRGVALTFAALSLPYLPLALWQSDLLLHSRLFLAGQSAVQSGTLGEIVPTVLSSFTTRQTGFPIAFYETFSGSLLALALLWRLRGGPRGLGLALAVAVVPVALMVLVNLRVSIFIDRYLTLAAPAFYLALAGGLVWLRRRFPAAALAWLGLFALLNAMPFYREHFLPFPVDGKWPAAAAYLEARRQPGEAVIFNRPEGRSAWEYYGHPADPEAVLPTALPAAADALAQRIAAGAPAGVWFVRTHEDAEVTATLNRWLYGFQLLEEKTFEGAQLAHYWARPAPAFDLPRVGQPLGARFEGTVALALVDAEAAVARAGGVWAVRLYWQSLRPSLPEYGMVLRLVDPAGNEVARVDGPPAYGHLPSWLWQAGQVVRDDRALPVPPGTPPGSYRLEVSVYERAGGRLLAVDGPDGRPAGVWAEAGRLEVRAPSRGNAAFDGAPSADFGERLHLAGATLPAEGMPGDSLPLQLRWRAGAGRLDELKVQIALDGPSGRAEWSEPLGTAGFPARDWRPGDEVTVRHALRLPPALAGGRYRLTLAVGAGDRWLSVGPAWWPFGGDRVALGEVVVRAREHRFTLPAIQHAATGELGGSVRLLGYDLERTPEGLAVTLHWQPGAEVGEPLTTFVHLLDGANNVVAQDDSAPCGGACPATGWVAGEVLADRKRVRIRPEVPAGRYRLEVGIYRTGDGRRLPAAGGGDSLLVGQVVLP